MPRLTDIGDSEALDNRYARKVIVYVEADMDATIFYGLAGTGIREYLEFKVPTSLSTGGNAVKNEVVQRRPEYPRIFGLIDGEDAVKEGAVDELLSCRSAMFQLAGGADGIIFLGHHEAENVLLIHGDLADLVRRDQSIPKSADMSDGEIDERIATVVRHFFHAALLKYASMTLNYRTNVLAPETGCKVIDSARFLASDDRKAILDAIKQGVQQEGVVDWMDLVDEVKRTWKVVRNEYVRARPDAARCSRERMRLADGKSVLKKLARLSASDPAKWNNHLLETARNKPFARQFRDDILTLTRATA
jgi:hypothetical protein